ncbi:MATE family efflux transporter [Chloroflexota bacterium]
MMKLQPTTERLGKAPLGRLLLSLSLPGIVSMTVMALYNIIDTFWVARLGYEAIAALTVVLPYHILSIAIAVGSGVGVSALTSRRFGEHNVEAANMAAGQIFPIAGIFGSLLLVVAVLFPRTVLVIGGATPDIMGYGTQYLVIIAFGTPFLVFAYTAGSLLRGSGDALRPMIFMLTGTVINIILDPLLIFGIGPFPEMGVKGAALATVIALIINAGLILYYIVANKSVYRIRLAYLKPRLRVLFDIYRVGFPSMVTTALEGVVFALFNNALASFSSLAIAAGGIAIRIADLAFMPIFGVAQGLLPIVGFCFGACLWKRLWLAVRLASISLVLFIGMILVLLEFFAPELIGLFSSDPELLAMAVPGIRIALSSLVIVGPTIMFVTAFQGMAKGKEAMILSLARWLVFFIPLVVFLPRILGIYGVWMSLPISDVLAFVMSGVWLFREYKLRQVQVIAEGCHVLLE